MTRSQIRRFSGQTSVIALALTAGLMPSQAFAAEEGDGTYSEIVVTAQRRSEGIEKVPISVAAFSEETLGNLKIESTDDLQFATPGITNTQTAGDGIAAVFIRGVGTGYSGPGLEGSVAFYLDDVYLQTQTASAQNTIDIDQVQVLKGPQGTLYGRNATGGAVVVTTRDPQLDTIEGYVKGGYGNLNWARGEGVVNVPMGETFAIRAAGFYERRDGYARNIVFPNEKKSGTGAGETYSVRVKARWQPSDAFNAVATFAYDRRNGNGAIHAHLFDPAGDPVGLGFYQTRQSPAREGGGGDDTDGIMGSLRLSYTTGDWTISNTTAYRRTRAYGCTDNDGVPEELLYFCTVSQRSPEPYDTDGKKDRTFTNELRVVSEMDGPLNVTAGVFFEDNKARFPGQVGGSFVGGLTPVFDNFNDLTAWSAYLELYYNLTERLKVTAGGRYTHEKKDHFATLIGIPGTDSFGKKSFDNFSPRLVLSYDADEWNLYASFNRGFKSGGFNSPGFAVSPPLKPEKISAFEAGAKYRSPDGKLFFSTAGYYYDWTNIQVSFITGGGAGISQQNAAGAEIYGLEADLNYSPSRALNLRAGLAWNHARYTDFTNAAVYNFNPATGTLWADVEDLSGRQVQHAPDFTANASVTYNFPIGDWSGSVTAAGRYTSKYDFTAGAGGVLRAARQDAHAMINLTGTFTTPSENIEFGWFVKNLTDKKLFSLISTGDTGVYYTPDEPRTYGVTAKYSF